ncbi:thioredoxin C-1 [Aedes albopictus]|uniref:Putative thioredoxin-like protein n=1 Tax=Aedes albopictus TaxID=7160 RepID=A0A023EGR0_AEDAL|nr:uncharacterized protein LOC109418062 [Aedes albopictus]
MNSVTKLISFRGATPAVVGRLLAGGVPQRCISTGQPRFCVFKIQSPQEFQEKVKDSKDPIIVDFFATWCGPCRMLTPRIESIVGEQKGKVKLAKVDIDEHTDLALDYEVASVPVLLAIRNGKVEQRLVGLQDTDKLRNWVEKVVKNEK